jgi:hypothetical protein
MKQVPRWMVGAVLLLASLSHAQPVEPRIGDFALQLPLTVSGDNGVVQLRLPLRVYQESLSPRLADVRVFNAAGQALPFALLPDTGSVRVVGRDSAAGLFPIYGAVGKSRETRLDFGLTSDGRLAWVRPKEASADEQALTGLILDLGSAHVDEVLESVQLLRSSNDTYRAEVAIDSSADLKQWNRIGQSRVDWLRSAQDDRALVNDRIALGVDGSRYLRVQWLEGTPAMFDRVLLHWRRTERVEPQLLEVTLDASTGKIAGDLLYSAPPAIAATQMQLDIAAANSVLPASIGYYRPLGNRASAVGFVPLAHESFYRLIQNGQERTSRPVSIEPWSTTQWVVRPDAATDMKPKLILRWYPSRIVFTARSNAQQDRQRFILTVRAAAPKIDEWVRHQTTLDRVAPGFDFKELTGLEEAVAGDWQNAGTPIVATSPKAATSAQTRSLVLWSVLVLGAVVLGAMTWRLYRQMQTPPS